MSGEDPPDPEDLIIDSAEPPVERGSDTQAVFVRWKCGNSVSALPDVCNKNTKLKWWQVELVNGRGKAIRNIRNWSAWMHLTLPDGTLVAWCEAKKPYKGATYCAKFPWDEMVRYGPGTYNLDLSAERKAEGEDECVVATPARFSIKLEGDPSDFPPPPPKLPNAQVLPMNEMLASPSKLLPVEPTKDGPPERPVKIERPKLEVRPTRPMTTHSPIPRPPAKTESRAPRPARARRSATKRSSEGSDASEASEPSEEREPGVNPDGSVYKGGWKEGEMHGHGRYTFPNGDVYNGDFARGHAHGWGSKVWKASGERYEGDWREDRRHGYGKLTGPRGTYEGMWAHDQMEGMGKFTHPNGDTYEGEFHEHEASGAGRKTYRDGSYYEGNWKHNMEHGHGRFWSGRKGDPEVEGQWQMGKPIDSNSDVCSACGKEGLLVCCDGCPNAYHVTCVNPPPPATDDAWYCPNCTSKQTGQPPPPQPASQSAVVISASTPIPPSSHRSATPPVRKPVEFTPAPVPVAARYPDAMPQRAPAVHPAVQLDEPTLPLASSQGSSNNNNNNNSVFNQAGPSSWVPFTEHPPAPAAPAGHYEPHGQPAYQDRQQGYAEHQHPQQTYADHPPAQTYPSVEQAMHLHGPPQHMQPAQFRPQEPPQPVGPAQGQYSNVYQQAWPSMGAAQPVHQQQIPMHMQMGQELPTSTTQTFDGQDYGRRQPAPGFNPIGVAGGLGGMGGLGGLGGGLGGYGLGQRSSGPRVPPASATRVSTPPAAAQNMYSQQPMRYHEPPTSGYGEGYPEANGGAPILPMKRPLQDGEDSEAKRTRMGGAPQSQGAWPSA